MTPVSIETLRLLLDYDPESGELKWKSRPREMFPNQRAFSTWNARYAGKPALITKMPNGYLAGKIFGVSYYAHRVILALVNGAWPDKTDHERGDRADNRHHILRDVSVVENNRNLKMRHDNTSGAPGVSWCKRTNRWQASIGVNYRKLSLGYHDDINDAIAARKAAEIKYGFHRNHGRAA